MSKALYRKYRSTSFDEVVGQEHVIESLKNALASDRLAHAYLFAGPRGVGKTSIARILAHAVNGLDYKETEQAHLDIIEIDAASNRRIDEIRELRSKIHSAPTSAKYKVYIIDEVHMLTNEAFNALLKTLEEPPAHALFILATTEPHKLPDTIISRTQHHTFRPVATETLVKHLKHIAKLEDVKIEDEALTLIAQHGGGSVRDSISLLDQVANLKDGPIFLSDIEAVLGRADSEFINGLLERLNSDDKSILDTLSQGFEHGVNPHILTHQLIEVLREQLHKGTKLIPRTQTLKLIDSLLEVEQSSDPRLKLEVVLLTHATGPQATEDTAVFAQKIATHPKQVVKKPTPPTDSLAKSDLQKPPETAEVAQRQPSKKAHSSKQTGATVDDTLWQNYLDILQSTHGALYATMRMAHVVEQSSDTLTLGFNFPLHQNRLEKNEKNKQIAENAMSELVGGTIKISAVIDKSQQAPVRQSTPVPESESVNQDIQSVIDVMGGTVVHES